LLIFKKANSKKIITCFGEKGSFSFFLKKF